MDMLIILHRCQKSNYFFTEMLHGGNFVLIFCETTKIYHLSFPAVDMGRKNC